MDGWLFTLAIVFGLLVVAMLVTWLADRWGGDE